MAWRPSAHAVQTMIRVLPHPKLLAVQADGEEGRFIYELRRDAADPASPTVIMAWRVEGAEQAAIRLPAGFGGESVKVTDMLGGESRVEAVNGAATVEIGPYPVYIQAE